MKVNFCCNICNESFNVSDENLIKKDSVVCPNCSTKFPEASFIELKEGIQKIYSCQKSLPLDMESSCEPEIDFKITY